MSPLKTVTISTSIALVATEAFAAVAQHQDLSVLDDFAISAELDSQLDAALARKDVREAVGSSFDLLARRLVRNDGRLEDQLFETVDGSTRSLKDILVAQSDFTSQGGADPNNFTGSVPVVACYGNCHNACHYACHGSRGWR